MAAIFICYRRDDTAGHARHLHAALSARFGREAVFFDHELDPGADFAARGLEALASCQIVLVLIGRQWAQLKGPDGRRRLDDPRDLVRIELERALERPGLEIVPVLVEQAAMPTGTQLPSSIAALARRNAATLGDARWDYDLVRLTGTVERALGRKPRGRPRPGRAISARIAVGLLVGAAVTVTAVVLMLTFVFDDRERAPAVSRSDVGALPRGWPATLQLGTTESDRDVDDDGLRLYYKRIGREGLGDVERVVEEMLAQVPEDRLAVLDLDAIGIESDSRRTLARLDDPGLMAAWFRAYRAVLQAARRDRRTVVLRVEPHVWGHAQLSLGEPARVPVQVGASGARAVAGDRDDLVGFSRALVRLRDDGDASNVLLMWQLDERGVDTDLFTAGDPDIPDLVRRSYRFYAALGARFDLVSYTAWADFRGREQRLYWPGHVAERQNAYLYAFARRTKRRAIVIGIPLAHAHNEGRGAADWSREASAVMRLRRLRDAGVIGVILVTGEDRRAVRRFAEQLRAGRALAL